MAKAITIQTIKDYLVWVEERNARVGMGGKFTFPDGETIDWQDTTSIRNLIKFLELTPKDKTQ